MPYSNTQWINECKKACGEALSLRVHIRLNDGGNYITEPSSMMAQTYTTNPADENAYGDVATTDRVYENVWHRSGATLDVNKVLAPTLTGYNSTEYSFVVQSTGGSTADKVVHHFQDDLFANRDSILFSIHATPYDLGTVNGGTRATGFTMTIRDETDGGMPYLATWKWDDTTHTPVLHSASPSLGAYGYEVVQSAGTEENYFRFWIGYSFPDGERGNQYSIAIAPFDTTATDPYVLATAPQLEVVNLIDRDTPSVWVREQLYSQPGTLVTLSGDNTTLGINPVLQRREREYGVVQGQNSQLTIANPETTLLSYFLETCWCSVEAGFESLDYWETILQGQIYNSSVSSNLTLTMTIDDSLMRLLEYELPRDYVFDTDPETFTGVASVTLIKTITKDEESEDYDNEYGYTDGTTPRVRILAGQEDKVTDHTYTIEFVSDKLFRVKFEDGSYWIDGVTTYPEYFHIGDAGITEENKSEYGDTDYNAVFGTPDEPTSSVFSVDWKGWNQDDNAYAAGDTFQFTTTAPREATKLTPMGMVKHLIKDVVSLKVYDVDSGSYNYSPFYSENAWDLYISQNERTAGGERFIAGEWERGSRVIDMIQDLLKVAHASIYPTNDGRIDFWAVEKPRLAGSPVELKGDPDRVDKNDIDDGVNVLNIKHQRGEDRFANHIRLSYKDFYTKEDAEIVSKDNLPEDLLRYKSIDVGWELSPSVASFAVNAAKVRFGQLADEIEAKTTLNVGAQLKLDAAMAIYDTMVNLYGLQVECIERSIDPLNQQFSIKGYNDPYYNLNFARVGHSPSVGYTQVGDTDYVIK